MEELEAEEKTQAESGGDEPVDLIELVRSKHDNVSIKNGTHRRRIGNAVNVMRYPAACFCSYKYFGIGYYSMVR